MVRLSVWEVWRCGMCVYLGNSTIGAAIKCNGQIFARLTALHNNVARSARASGSPSPLTPPLPHLALHQRQHPVCLLHPGMGLLDGDLLPRGLVGGSGPSGLLDLEGRRIECHSAHMHLL